MTRVRLMLVVLAACVAMCPAIGSAQTTGSIAGTVKDTTGAVLPGVTVEAASPALIEKVRVAVSDAQGNYQIVDLRPGTYTVTFTLGGFSAYRREGIELSAGFTATANADMKVGALEETVTVTGASPIVDVQNVRRQNVLTAEVLQALPSNKGNAAFAALTLGATIATIAHDVGGNTGEQSPSVSIHGSRANDSKLLVDGMSYNSFHLEGGGQMRIFLRNQMSVQETVLGTGGVSAESETGGVQINYVPRDGGNTFTAQFIGNYTSKRLQGNNLNDELRARGLTLFPPVKQVWDWGGGFGGRISRDRLWFYSSARLWGAQTYIPGGYYNSGLGTFIGAPNSGVTRYVPDLDRPSYTETWARDFGGRVTWQASARNKFTLADNMQRSCECGNGSATAAPETASHFTYGPSHLVQATWSYPRTSRLLLDAGASFGVFKITLPRHSGSTENHIGIQELSSGGVSYGAFAGRIDSSAAYGGGHSDNYNQRFAVSYVTGSHALKAGLQTLFGNHPQQAEINQAISYQFLNGVPQTITEWASPFEGMSRVRSWGLFVQDQWRVRRLAINAGVRLDQFYGWNPAQTRPTGRFVPAFPADEVRNVPNYKDVTPRGGVSYDLFGDGRTALKFSLGRYVGSQGAGIAISNLPGLAIGQSATRQWTDGNSDFVPNCDLASIAPNGECGALDSRTFGRPIPTISYLPEAITGWGRRPGNVQLAVSGQHELRPGFGVDVGYFRTSFLNFTALENRAVTAADFTSYCVTAPADARLPQGGGYQVCGLYDVNPNRFGLVDNAVVRASRFGEHKEAFDAVDISMNARFGRGFVAGGVSLGRRVQDTCYQNDKPQIVAGSFGNATVSATAVTGPRTEAFCHVTPPWSADSQVKFNGSYRLPWDVQASMVYQNLPGQQMSATLVVPNAVIAPVLGRNLSAGAAGFASVALIPPGTMYEDRLNQVDLRFSKIVRVQRIRLQGMFDIYNVGNSGAVLNSVTTYGAAWLRPTRILGARLFKFGVQFDW